MQGSLQALGDFFEFWGKHLPSQADLNVLCPPNVYLGNLAEYIQKYPTLKIGAQDLSEFAPGAYTGQVAARMLVDQGCEYVIVGHSECRQYGHDTDEIVANKFYAAQRAGLIPILCVGESQAEYEAGLSHAIVMKQVGEIIKREGIAVFQKAILAYEPIWAIGTGLTATPDQAQALHHLLRQSLAEYDASVARNLTILYGGSVKPQNAAALLAMPDIDGVLVGGASLQAQDFLAICNA